MPWGSREEHFSRGNIFLRRSPERNFEGPWRSQSSWQTEPRQWSSAECQRGNGVEGHAKGLVGYCQDSWLLLCVRMGDTWKVWAEGWFSDLELKESFFVLCWDPAVGAGDGKKQGHNQWVSEMVFKLECMTPKATWKPYRDTSL